MGNPFSALAAVLVGWIAVLVLMVLHSELSLRRGWWRGTATVSPSDPHPFAGVAPPIADVLIQQQPHEIGRYRGLKEVSRTLSARPFALRLDDGRQAWVEPGSNIRIACDLEPGGTLGIVSRHGVLKEGDRLLIKGEIAPEGGGEPGPYRGSPPRVLLRAPAGRPLWLVAASTLARHARHQRLLGLVFVALGLFSLFVLVRDVMPMSWATAADRQVWSWMVVAGEIGLYVLCWWRIRPWYARRRFNQSRSSYLTTLAE